MTTAPDELLAEPIRRSLWRMGWDHLRPLQASAICAILQSENDVVLAARTAAGKTEAAFLPILSRICDAALGSIRALYVGPLKALINDQFRRLEELCDYAEIPVHRWHGDVPAEKKRQLAERPGGVLLITPESLESLFVNKSSALNQLFHSLSFVVIDELHAMLGVERGVQLQSQLCRLSRYSVTPFRLVALSATIGDLEAAARWMRPDTPQSVTILRDDSEQTAIRYRIHGYLTVPDTSNEPSPPGDEQSPDDRQPVPPANFYGDIYENFRGTKNLIFANSKRVVEDVTDHLNDLCRRDGTREEFLIHHGSLSREIREETERLMQEARPHTTVCSSSLELGIDIGNVRMIGQIGPTRSVSSLVQRLGRSGRAEGEAHQMRVLITEIPPSVRSDVFERIYFDLLQSVATSELMLEKWVESPNPEPCDLSTLVQQTLSCIAETGGPKVGELSQRLVEQGAFRFLATEQFTRFLQSLAEHDLVEPQADGALILGLAGERIVRHYEFYAAFASSPEYRVVFGSRLIGLIDVMGVPRPDEHLLLGGRRWQVIAVDEDREEVRVQPATGRKPPWFVDDGDIEVDPRIRQKMRELLLSHSTHAYLDTQAQKMLADSRKQAVQAGLQSATWIPTGPQSLLWFPWTGTRAMRTLQLICNWANIPAVGRDGLAFLVRMSPDNFVEAIRKILQTFPQGDDLIDKDANCEKRKWDRFVDPALLRTMYLKDRLDLSLAKACLTDAVASS
jgi:ATP-dependent Lhr-like helicase